MRASTEIKQIPITCTYNCGARCELQAHVKDNQLIRIDTPGNRNDSIKTPRIIPCVKGRALRRSLSDPERIKNPLKRTGRARATLETRQAQLFMNIFINYSSKGYQKDLENILSMSSTYSPPTG